MGHTLCSVYSRWVVGLLEWRRLRKLCRTVAQRVNVGMDAVCGGMVLAVD